MAKSNGFLPVTPDEVKKRDLDAPDFGYVTGDAYVDHPFLRPDHLNWVLEQVVTRFEATGEEDTGSRE